MNRISLIPILTKQRKYLNNRKNTSALDLIKKYTGHDIVWTQIQDYLRKPSLKTYSDLLSSFKTLDNAKNTILELQELIYNAPRSNIPTKVYRSVEEVVEM